MSGQNYGICKGCGKQILWTRTSAGKNMPLDPYIIHFERGGKENFVTPSGETVRGTRSESGEIGYIPHWATCPQYKRFK